MENLKDYGDKIPAVKKENIEVLQITRVHDAISNFPVVTKDAGLLQHGVHEGGFTMVDVRDNGDITKLWMRQRVLLGERK